MMNGTAALLTLSHFLSDYSSLPLPSFPSSSLAIALLHATAFFHLYRSLHTSLPAMGLPQFNLNHKLNPLLGQCPRQIDVTACLPKHTGNASNQRDGASSIHQIHAIPVRVSFSYHAIKRNDDAAAGR